MPAFTHEDFVNRVVAEFPELAYDIIEVCDEMPTLQVAALAHHLQLAKGKADWSTYERGIKLVAEFWDRADQQLDWELRWRFVNNLDFTGVRGPVAWAYLTPEMQRSWTFTQSQVTPLRILRKKTKKRGG